MTAADRPPAPLLVLAEFVFTEEGEAAFLEERDRTLAEVRGVEGCLQAALWSRPGRRYQFTTLWTDAEAVTRWVENDFHRDVLMPAFRDWCTEGCFGDYVLASDHARARLCAACGRWTRGEPGWDERGPAACRRCGAPLEGAIDGR
jgi:heme-degrading monooxygenase HmoA